MIESKNIEFFKNLSQLEFDDQYYDLHNDFDCVNITFNLNNLILTFRHLKLKIEVLIIFCETQLVFFDFFNCNKVKHLTIDNLYRGRKQVSEELLDLLDGKLGYYYLEFDEGQQIELWSSGLNLKKKNMSTSI